MEYGGWRLFVLVDIVREDELQVVVRQLQERMQVEAPFEVSFAPRAGESGHLQARRAARREAR